MLKQLDIIEHFKDFVVYLICYFEYLLVSLGSLTNFYLEFF